MGGSLSFLNSNPSTSHYDKIIPNLYIGDKYSIYEPFFSHQPKLLIINATKNVLYNKKLNADTIRIPVDDDLSEFSNIILRNNLNKITGIIDTYLKNEYIILVHCVAGRQRSCSIVAGYLMKFKNYHMKHAIEFIQSKRPYAFFINVNFERSLKKFSQTLK